MDLVYEALHVSLGIENPPKPRNVVRIGNRRVGHTRPLKLVFHSEANRNEIFQCYLDTNRKHPGRLQGVTISSDRTKKQNDEYRALKRELDERTSKGEKDLRIRGGRIIKTTRPFRMGGGGAGQY